MRCSCARTIPSASSAQRRTPKLSLAPSSSASPTPGASSSVKAGVPRRQARRARDLAEHRAQRAERLERQVQHRGIAAVEARRMVRNLQPERDTAGVQSRGEREHERAARPHVRRSSRRARSRRHRHRHRHRRSRCRTRATARAAPSAHEGRRRCRASASRGSRRPRTRPRSRPFTTTASSPSTWSTVHPRSQRPRPPLASDSAESSHGSPATGWGSPQRAGTGDPWQ